MHQNVFIYGKKKKTMDAMMNYFLRIAAGMLAIYLVNTILESFSLPIQVGMNTYNILVMGIFGTPGLLLLYGVSTYFMFRG